MKFTVLSVATCKCAAYLVVQFLACTGTLSAYLAVQFVIKCCAHLLGKQLSVSLNWVVLKRTGCCCKSSMCVYAYAFLEVFLGRSTAWMLGSTPPWAMVTPPKSLFNSSSLRMASCKCRGMILVFLLSRAAFPANSRTSALRYSKTAARYTGAPAPTRSE